MSRFTFTSESVSEGHPDKVCDYISDSVLDACLSEDTKSRVACETLVKSDHVVLAGAITTNAKLDFDKIVRQAVKEIGYTDTSEPFCDTTLKLVSLITKQSNEISQGVTEATSQSGDQGAGDQGIMTIQGYPDPGEGLRLHLNENTGGCSPRVLEAIRRVRTTDVSTYPSYPALVAACARHFGVDPGWVLLTNGLDECILMQESGKYVVVDSLFREWVARRTF